MTEECCDTITRADLLNVGIDPNQYMMDWENEISIGDIILAAESDVSYRKNLFKTADILNSYTNSNKEVGLMYKQEKTKMQS